MAVQVVSLGILPNINTGNINNPQSSSMNLQGGGSSVPAVSGVKAATPINNIKPPSNTLAPKYATPTVQASTVKQLPVGLQPGLDAASARIAAGTANQKDKDNVAYAQKNYGYSYKAPATTTASSSLPGLNGTPSAQTTQPTTYSEPANSGLIGQLIAGAANTASQPTPGYTAAQSGATGAATQLQSTASQPNAGYSTAETGLNTIGSTPSPQVQQAMDEVAALKNEFAQKGINIQQTGGFLTQANGEQGLLQNQYLTALDAAQTKLNNALQEQGQQISAFGSAANAGNTQQQTQQSGLASAGGLFGQLQSAATAQQGTQQTGLLGAANATQPIQVPYSNQVLSPLTGQPIGGGSAGQLPAAAQQAVNIYAQQVQNGSMTRADAESRLSAYGVAGINALTQALGPNFNTNASNASAGTTAIGQQIQTAANSTNQALDTLVTSFNSLPGWQTGGVPATNSIGQWIGQQFGDAALQQYKTNLADARSQLIGVLNSSGGTPTGNEATANQYLPDNMTKQQFDANVGTQQNPGIVRQLITQKVGSFTSSGQQNSNTGTSGGGLYSF